jgi:hypothetical protein
MLNDLGKPDVPAATVLTLTPKPRTIKQANYK